MNGLRHREDGPAVIYSNGTQEWYFNGKLHREDGPAVISKSYDAWYINGKKHRENGPAVIWTNGDQVWYLNGERHRTDGPAVIWTNGYHEWWVNGVCIPNVELWIQKQQISLPLDAETQAQFLLTFN